MRNRQSCRERPFVSSAQGLAQGQRVWDNVLDLVEDDGRGLPYPEQSHNGSEDGQADDGLVVRERQEEDIVVFHAVRAVVVATLDERLALLGLGAGWGRGRLRARGPSHLDGGSKRWWSVATRGGSVVGRGVSVISCPAWQDDGQLQAPGRAWKL